MKVRVSGNTNGQMTYVNTGYAAARDAVARRAQGVKTEERIPEGVGMRKRVEVGVRVGVKEVGDWVVNV